MKVRQHLYLTFSPADTDHKFCPLANFYISHLSELPGMYPLFSEKKRKKKDYILDNSMISFFLSEWGIFT